MEHLIHTDDDLLISFHINEIAIFIHREILYDICLVDNQRCLEESQPCKYRRMDNFYWS